MERAACGLHPVRSVSESLHELHPLPGWATDAGWAGACAPVGPLAPEHSVAPAVRGHFDESEGEQECHSDEGGGEGEGSCQGDDELVSEQPTNGKDSPFSFPSVYMSFYNTLRSQMAATPGRDR